MGGSIGPYAFTLLVFFFTLSFHVLDLPAQETVKIAYPSTSYSTMPIVVARREGFFSQEGLIGQLIQIRPNIGITALVNGEVDFATTQGSVVRAAARGIPIKSVAIIADRPVYFLVARPAFNSVASLSAKTKTVIGVNSLGGSVHMITKEILVRHGLNPDKDVAIIVSGDNQTSLQAVQLGRIDATLIPIPWQTQAKKLGLKVLSYAGDLVQLPLGGLGTTERLIQKKPELVKKVIRATLKGTAFIRDKRNKERVLEAMTQWFGIAHDVANDSYEQMILAYPINGATSTEALKKDLDIAQQLGGIPAGVPLSRVVDFQLLREVQKELGLPN
ncbi:MAG: ABC transporter substrate-binding protein [Deltaproteobacteria bacterium]|nr:ABC transporter substrate-binding protein [Deltaproteobacteria bacterium]